jgi:Pectate lyase superfamily protein
MIRPLRLITFILAFVFSMPATAMAASAPCLPPLCTAFPKDAGALNVRDFGAKGDGLADDTAAINAALTASGGDTGPAFWQDRIVYFPAGTYKVSAPITKRYANGSFGSGMILIGENRDKTIIRLSDNASGYGNPAAPKAIIFTTAKLLDGGGPTAGGKDYFHKGEGNDAFMNFVENMTIDTGEGNPGAIGIDYLANNMGAVRNVWVHAPPSSGAIGIALNRKWPGPALLKNVVIEGFAIGIDVAHTEYGITMESIALKDQRQLGLRNNHNMVAVHDITISNAPQPIVNGSADGLIVINGGTLTHESSDNDAIENAGYLNLHAVTIDGYKTALGKTITAPLSGVYQQQTPLSSARSSWSLPVEYPPALPEEGVNKWVNVATFGAIPDTGEDTTSAIRKAFASGASTLYFPHGVYRISDNIIIPATVQRIVGMTSTIRAFPGRAASFKREQGMFRAMNNTNPLTIERLAFDNSWQGDQAGVEATGRKPVFLSDVVGAGVVTLLRPKSGGKVFIENTCCGTIDVAGKKGVWARQLNTEGGGVRIKNSGAPLWILGVKTEHNCTVLENTNRARTEIIGGLIYITGTSANPDIPAFTNINSRLLLSYMEESFHPESTYAIHLKDTKGATTQTTLAETLPKRTIGRIVPQLKSQ